MDLQKSVRAERGQALVIMIFAMIALLVIAGLAIDGGMVFLERRRMQNSADAAALAGTRLLAAAVCGKQGADDTAIFAEARQYAEKNGVQDTGNVVADYVSFDEVVLGRVGGGTIPPGSTGVSVTVGITRPTHFVSLVGISEARASASALAMTGRPIVASGLRPFGVPLDVVQQLSDGDCFEISFGQHCDDQHQDCTIEYLDGQTSSHRGWMNMNYVWNQYEELSGWPRATSPNPGGDLMDWMQNGWDGTLYADGLWAFLYRNGDFIHANPGTEQDALNVAPIGELILVPVFDAFPDCDGVPPDLEPPWPSPPGAPKDACTGMAGASYYHIVGFASVTIEDVHTSNHSLEVCVEKITIGQGQPSPSAGYGSDVCAMHTMVVTLWK